MLAFDSISRFADTRIFDLQCRRKKKRKEKMGSRNLREEKGREKDKNVTIADNFQTYYGR